MENHTEKTKDKDIIGLLAVIFLVVGGLNWGLVGLMGVDLVKILFGDMTAVSRIIYLLVGASTIYVLVSPPKICRK